MKKKAISSYLSKLSRSRILGRLEKQIQYRRGIFKKLDEEKSEANNHLVSFFFLLAIRQDVTNRFIHSTSR